MPQTNTDFSLNEDSFKQIPQFTNSINSLKSSINNLNKEITNATDKLNKFNTQNKEATTWGTKVKETVKDLKESFDAIDSAISLAKDAVAGWEGALTAGFTLILTYGPQVLEFLGNLFQSDKAKEAAQSLKDYKDVMDSYNDNLSGEISQLGMLTAVANNETLSKENRAEAIKKLNEISPDYLKNLTLENLKTKEGQKAIEEYTKALNRKAMEEAIQAKRTEIVKQRYDLKEDYDSKKANWNDYKTGKKKDERQTSTMGPMDGVPGSAAYSPKAEAEAKFKEVADKDKALVTRLNKLDKDLAETLTKYAPTPSANQGKNKAYWEQMLNDQQMKLSKLDSSSKDFEQKSKPIAARIKNAQKMLSLYNVQDEIKKPKQPKKTPKDDPELAAREESIKRMALMQYEGYAQEIEATNQHFDAMIKLHQKNKATVEQLKKEHVATLLKIDEKFHKEDAEKLKSYQEQLQAISIKQAKTAQEEALDQLQKDYDDKQKVIQQATSNAKKIESELNNYLETNRKNLSEKQISILQSNIAQAISVQQDGNQKKIALDKQYQNDKLKIENSFSAEEKKKQFDKDKSKLENSASDAHDHGNWKSEFKAKQDLLDLEKKQALDSVKGQAEEEDKIKREYTKKQQQLDKDKLDAQAENQKQYLKSLDSLSNAVTGIFGKNSEAAKIAFKAHQAASAAQVIVDTERSIMGIWAADAGLPIVGVPKAIAETAIVAATGASSLASILKQKPNFASGGQFISDGRGAVLSGYSRTDNTNAYLRSGEAVVVSEAMRNPWARNLVSAVNVAFGGRDFSISNPGRGYAIGGIFTDGGNANRYYSQPMNDVKDLANTLAYQMINNFPPVYVDVKDINNQQNILAQTVNRVNL